MNLDHVRYFLSAAELNSITLAAQRHRVTPSSLSQAITSLEQSLGSTLITHERRKFVLTTSGSLFVELGFKLLQQVDSIKRSCIDVESPQKQTVTIACTNSFANAFLANILHKLCLFRSDFPFKIILGNSDTIQDWLINGGADVGIFLEDGSKHELNRVTLKSGSFKLASKVTENYLRRPILVTRKTKPEVARLVNFLNEADRSATSEPVFQEILSWEVCNTLALKGYGSALLPDYLIESALRQGLLKSINLSETALEKYRLILCTNPQRFETTNTQFFCKFIRKLFKDRMESRVPTTQ
jgi:DNA-binding transcriptional LysR family regulator